VTDITVVFLFVFSTYRPEGAAEIRYAECSLKNGFGLMHLHKFLSVPFLQLQVIVGGVVLGVVLELSLWSISKLA